MFGVFDDSLPDGWGRLLVDRLLRSHGIDPFAVSPIARLAIVGFNGMGALEYVPEIPLTSPATSTDFDELARECASVLAADGSRPKVLTSIDGDDWIVKFASSQDDRDIGESEYRYALAAKACGIDMPEVRLFPSKRCSGYFGVRRFDRVPDASGVARKVHMVSAGALLETSHRIPNLDYETLMRLTLKLTDSFEEVVRLYRLMCFNVLAGNRDDHATTVNGKGKGIGLDDLVSVGVKAGLSKSSARTIADEVRQATAGRL